MVSVKDRVRSGPSHPPAYSHPLSSLSAYIPIRAMLTPTRVRGYNLSIELAGRTNALTFEIYKKRTKASSSVAVDFQSNTVHTVDTVLLREDPIHEALPGLALLLSYCLPKVLRFDEVDTSSLAGIFDLF